VSWISGSRIVMFVSFILILSVVGVCPRPAYAQAPELITPLAANRLAAATPDQTQRIDQIRSRPTTASTELVDINIDALRGDSTRVSIPNGQTLTLSRRNMEVRTANDFTWSGSLSGGPGQATFVVHDGRVTGSVQAGGALYRIEPVGGSVHALIKVDERRFPPDHPPSFDEKAKRGDTRPTTGFPSAAAKQDGPVGIDVLVAYTPSARTAVGDIGATIQLAVAEANQSYINSGVNIKLSLVDSFELPYVESGKTFETILADFVANQTVSSRRDGSNADLSAMIINQTDFCGLADAIRAEASTAFAVVHYDCATGYYSFAHELGHLQGARHDPANDPTASPFPYGHGLQHLTPTPAWRTIMAYNCTGGCSRLQYWSNPNVLYNGIPMGSAALNDNARVLNETATTVAAFRPIGTPASTCRSGYVQQGTWLCMTGSRGPASFANASLDCMDSGGRVANYHDWRYRIFRGDGTPGPTNAWLGPITADNTALFVNSSNVADFDGETSRFDIRSYACSHDLAR
jgi:peptidyl-Asp metalloendopeptidase